MHLWPTKSIRESWTLPHIKHVDRVIREKRAERRSQEQKLLDNGGEANCNSFKGQSFFGYDSKLRCICRDLVFVFTCCFCFGACMDEIDYYSNY